jgi:hypothetical protein
MAQDKSDSTLKELPEMMPEELLQEFDRVYRKLAMPCFQITEQGLVKIKEPPSYVDILETYYLQVHYPIFNLVL